MEEDKYIELFFLATFTDDGGIFLIPHVEIDSPEMAEVAVPHNEPGVLYAITFYVTNIPNWQPCILEMVLLKNLVDDKFSELLNEIKNPGS